MEAAAVYDEKNGWVRFDVDAVDEPVTVNEMKRPRGRPPRVEVVDVGA